MSLSDSNTDSVDSIVGDLEGTFSDSLLGLLSADVCRRRLRLSFKGGGNGKRRRLVGELTGLSSSPADQQADVGCAALSAEACDAVVDGRLTLYAPESTDSSALTAEVLEIMRTSMSDGTYASNDPRIDRLALVEPGVQGITEGEDADQLETLGDEGAGGPSRRMPFVVAGSVVAALLVLLLLMCGLRRRRKEGAADEDSDEESRESNDDPSVGIPAEGEDKGTNEQNTSLLR